MVCDDRQRRVLWFAKEYWCGGKSARAMRLGRWTWGEEERVGSKDPIVSVGRARRNRVGEEVWGRGVGKKKRW